MADIVEIGLVVRDKGLKESITAVTRLERQVTAASKAVEKGTITQDRYNKILLSAKREYEKLGVSSQKSTAVVRRFADEQRRLAIEAQKAGQTMARGYAKAGTQLNATSSKVRQTFLNTANSIAILDGPLGGVASRFSAFGVLIGRTGILLGVALAAFSALGVAVTKSVRAYAEFEAQSARMNAILQTTGNQAGLTGFQIESMASRIALNTLESEQAVRSAATQLLTFKNVGKDVFETTLKAATDMAALGFGTVESEAVKLAKALEDPRQSLTSLSRSGITFTRQQRQLITSLVESGRQAEAMDRILDNVNSQVGGAGEAAARDTMAGAFDTIGQAVSRATREFGEFVVETLRLGSVLKGLASALAPYAGGPLPIEEQLSSARSELGNFRRELVEAQALYNDPTFLGTAQLTRGQRGPQAVEADIFAREELIRKLEDQLILESRIASAAEATNAAKSRAGALDNLQAQADALRENIGLTEQQIRVNSMLAAEGALNIDMSAAVNDYRNNLVAAQIPQRAITQMVRDFEQALMDTAKAGDDLAAALDAAEAGREFSRRIRSLEDENALMEEQIKLIDQGVEFTDAIRRAEHTLAIQRAVNLALMADTTAEYEKQFAIAAAMATAFERNEELRTQLGVRRPETVRTPRGGGSEREPTNIADIISKMEQEVANQNTLLKLQGDEIRIQEILFDLKDKNASADIKMTEDNLRLAAERIAANERVNQSIEEMNATQQTMADTLQSSMSDAFMSMVEGTMKAKDAFREMARQIIKQLFDILVVQNLVGSFTGTGGGIVGSIMKMFSFDGGGYTGNGPRSGGVDGKGGFPAILHPRETVVDHTKGGKQSGGGDNIVINQSFNFSANGDESVKKLIAEAAPQIANMTQQKMLDQRRRGGVVKSTFG